MHVSETHNTHSRWNKFVVIHDCSKCHVIRFVGDLFPTGRQILSWPVSSGLATLWLHMPLAALKKSAILPKDLTNPHPSGSTSLTERTVTLNQKWFRSVFPMSKVGVNMSNIITNCPNRLYLLLTSCWLHALKCYDFQILSQPLSVSCGSWAMSRSNSVSWCNNIKCHF